MYHCTIGVGCPEAEQNIIIALPPTLNGFDEEAAVEIIGQSEIKHYKNFTKNKTKNFIEYI